VLCVASGGFVLPELAAAPLDGLRGELGLPPDPQLAMLGRHRVIAPFPPSFRDPANPLPSTARAVRLGRVGAPVERNARTRIYFTLGTIFNVEAGDLFDRVLRGLSQLDADVVATVGRELDPDELAPQPAHVRLERFVPQAELLPGCDLVVTHGGSGSVLGALTHGVPLVLLPVGADQPFNAARCETLGAGIVLDSFRATADEIAAAARHVLGDASFRRSAGRLRDELAALPGPEYAVELVEALGRVSRAAR
jgi:MGT family glycosyltransferase